MVECLFEQRCNARKSFVVFSVSLSLQAGLNEIVVNDHIIVRDLIGMRESEREPNVTVEVGRCVLCLHFLQLQLDLRLLEALGESRSSEGRGRRFRGRFGGRERRNEKARTRLISLVDEANGVGRKHVDGCVA